MVTVSVVMSVRAYLLVLLWSLLPHAQALIFAQAHKPISQQSSVILSSVFSIGLTLFLLSCHFLTPSSDRRPASYAIIIIFLKEIELVVGEWCMLSPPSV